ncbi:MULTISPECIES: MFS transporter small subunit [Actinoalloteichus]|uniref:Uncharacterized protein n=1 Tax=Actinoalloteichus fjordicus TaxID=1612552 RepID=A0AAC9PR35_9PSEU|nr:MULTISPECIES: hypothetical protein [Actinoalloteichus]APU13688.1 hypothetical protein UA74_08110 [Actinoalloteichus fjordicus]APU19634.1 hypothetical protein UA75_08090 [Actinoalloteichus sp. GBA129-24]
MSAEDALPEGTPARRRIGLMTFAWLWVGLPFAYGLAELVRTVTRLFVG